MPTPCSTSSRIGAIQFLLRAHVDAARRVVQQHDRCGRGRSSGRRRASAGCRPRALRRARAGPRVRTESAAARRRSSRARGAAARLARRAGGRSQGASRFSPTPRASARPSRLAVLGNEAEAAAARLATGCQASRPACRRSASDVGAGRGGAEQARAAARPVRGPAGRRCRGSRRGEPMRSTPGRPSARRFSHLERDRCVGVRSRGRLGEVAAGSAAGHERDEFVVGPGAARELATDGAVAQHGAAVGDLGDLAEAVRDVDDADAVGGELADAGEEPVHARGVQRRRCLIEDEQPGPGGDGAHDLDELTVGERSESTTARRVDVRAVSSRSSSSAGATELAAARTGRGPRRSGRHEVLGDGPVGHEGELLEGARDAVARAPRATLPDAERLPSNVMVPEVGSVAPARIRATVLLPAPFSPTRASTSPA